MKQLVAAITLLLFTLPLAAVEVVSTADDPFVIYQAEGNYEDIKFNLELAIEGKGLKISNTLHISDMLSRTAADADMPEPEYQKAESLEFCSALVTHLMTQAHPANLANCPLTINIYQMKDAPDHVFVSYRRPQMLGDAEQALDKLNGLLQEIIRDMQQ